MPAVLLFPDGSIELEADARFRSVRLALCFKLGGVHVRYQPPLASDVPAVERFLYDAMKECCFARGYTEDDLVTLGLETILEKIQEEEATNEEEAKT